MDVKKNEDRSLGLKTSIKTNNTQRISIINPEMKNINQDLLFFKNDILLDIRKIEENFNIKLSKINIVSSEQYDSFDKKISELSERISRIHSWILDNNELPVKFNTFVRFQTKVEEYFSRINSKIISIQNENKDFIISSEKLISENLKYPGVIGINGKFLNFRYFIDYTMKNFNDLNEFRDEIIKLNLVELRKEINTTISDFRTTISDNYLNSARLITNNIQEFDKKIQDIIIRNYKNMEENEVKFEELKNNINKYFSEYQTKFELLGKNLNDKFDEQLKEIDVLKNMRNELSTQTNNVKSYLENIKSLSNNIITNINFKANNNDRNQKKILSDDSNKFDYQVISTYSQKNNKILNDQINNNNFKNIDILDNYQKSEVQHNTDFSSEKRNNHMVLDRPKSYEKIPEKNNYFKTRNKNKDLSFTHYELKNKEDNKDIYTYLNKTNKDFTKNNYSISNIANIKIKQVILPENISKRNINRKSDSLLSDNKKEILISNDLSSNIPHKSLYFDDIRKRIFNISKINKQKVLINKNRDINLVHSARTINRIVEINNPEKLNSKIKMKPKSKNNIFKKLDFCKKGKKYNLSFEKNKISKDEKSQIGFWKTLNLKCSVKDLFLLNSKTFKNNRKIQF